MKNKIVDKLKKLISIETIASISCGGCPMKDLCNNKEKGGQQR